MRYVMRMTTITSGFQPSRHGAAAILGFGMLFLASLFPVRAAELIMFERPGCIWCLRWHKEVGPIYPKTPEGQRAPLRAVMIGARPEPGLRLNEPVFYTPTFVLVEKGEEIGRITGYMGDDAFWGLMKMLAGKLDAAARLGN